MEQEYVKVITDEHIGRYFSANICGEIVKEGLIIKENESYYLLQNNISGSSPPSGNLEGYKFGWTTDNGTNLHLRFSVTELKILDSKKISWTTVKYLISKR